VVFEEVLSTGVIITREIPNPAPREPGEVLLEVDPETGLPIWDIGRQPYVGPTDEEPFSDELLIPKIVLKRIQARYRKELSSIPGVNAFGIGARGFVVFLDPKHPENESLVPQELEGIPIEVQLGGPFQTLSHNRTVYRPVPIGSTVGAFRPEEANGGTLGLHIVLRNPSRIWSLTASHVVMRPSEPASQVRGRNVYQPDPTAPGYVFWGVVAQAWQKTPCANPPSCTGDPANFSSVTPDVVTIAHMNLSHTDTYPHRVLTDPEDTNNGTTPSQSPIRRMYYGTTSFVNGPSGIVEQIRQGKEIKWWGAFSCCPHAPVGRVTATNMEAAVLDVASRLWFKYSALDFVNLERRAQRGDSVGLVAGNGLGTDIYLAQSLALMQTRRPLASTTLPWIFKLL
jgi:hypothetical protein